MSVHDNGTYLILYHSTTSQRLPNCYNSLDLFIPIENYGNTYQIIERFREILLFPKINKSLLEFCYTYQIIEYYLSQQISPIVENKFIVFILTLLYDKFDTIKGYLKYQSFECIVLSRDGRMEYRIMSKVTFHNVIFFPHKSIIVIESFEYIFVWRDGRMDMGSSSQQTVRI